MRQHDRWTLRVIRRYQERGHRVGCCVFTPTCSDYARLAIARHGTFRGLAMTTRRLLRCHGGNAGATDFPT